MIDYLTDRYGTSQRRACRLLAVPRSVHGYRSRRDPQTLLRRRMRKIAATDPIETSEGWNVSLLTKGVVRVIAACYLGIACTGTPGQNF